MFLTWGTLASRASGPAPGDCTNFRPIIEHNSRDNFDRPSHCIHQLYEFPGEHQHTTTFAVRQNVQKDHFQCRGALKTTFSSILEPYTSYILGCDRSSFSPCQLLKLHVAARSALGIVCGSKEAYCPGHAVVHWRVLRGGRTYHVTFIA